MPPIAESTLILSMAVAFAAGAIADRLYRTRKPREVAQILECGLPRDKYLAESLNWYASNANWHRKKGPRGARSWANCPAMEDKGGRARQALGGSDLFETAKEMRNAAMD